MSHDLADRGAFAERVRLQLQARYRGVSITVAGNHFGLQATAPGIDVLLPLSPLHHQVLRTPDRTATVIAAWVAAVERQLNPAPTTQLAIERLLWCVRSRSSINDLARADELLTSQVGTDMVAFVAESLPGAVMRGVPRQEWEEHNITDEEVRQATTRATNARFESLIDRLRSTEHIPKDGWRLTGDLLFQGSVAMSPAVLTAFVERAGGEVIVALPDRTLVLALPAVADSATTFSHRVNQAVREAMAPCSRELLITDGREVRPYRTTGARRSPGLMAWLRD